MTILVVEDNPDNLTLLEEILEEAGYAVVKATRAEAGLAWLQEHGADLVLMDLSLPQMSGLEAIRIIRADPATKRVPIIVLTAHAMASDQEAARSIGCDAYLTKPMNEDLLLATIRTLLS